MPKLHRVSRKNVRAFAVLNRHTDFQSHRLQNVTLLAIRVMQQSDSRRPVGVVLNRCDLRRDTRFVAAEVDVAILARVSATAVPGSDFALGVAAAGALLGLPQGFVPRL